MSKAQKKVGRVIHPNRSRVARIIFAALLVVLLSTLGFSARAWLRPLVGKVWPKLSATEAVPSPQQPQKVTVTLREDGFTPSSMTRAAGPFLLAIDNRSGVSELSFHLLHDGKQKRTLEFRVPATAQGFSQPLNLEVGEYTIKETNHPAWLFHITVR